MLKNEQLNKQSAGLMVIDVQDKLIWHVEQSEEILRTMQQVIKGCQILKMPIVVTEQYPQGLGHTEGEIKSLLPHDQQYLAKTTFSSLDDPMIQKVILDMAVQQWILVGIEAHVCVLQTAKTLLKLGKQVTVLNDAIGSRSIYNFATAIAELRDLGVRVTSAETVLFELVGDSKLGEFKAISQLIKDKDEESCCQTRMGCCQG